MDAEDIARSIDEAKHQKPQVLSTSQSEASKKDGPTIRQRWRDTMFYRHVDLIPNFEFGYWEETLRNWHKEGLPEHVNDGNSAYAWFGIEDWEWAWAELSLSPIFPDETLADDGEIRTYRDGGSGAIAQINTHGNKSIPHFTEFLLKDRQSWEEHFLPRLQPDSARLVGDWKQKAIAWRQSQRPVTIGIGSLMGMPRNWMGFEGIALMQYDDPKLLEEIIEQSCQVICSTLEMALPMAEFDFGSGWEDICFNSGPILSVDFIRSVVVPRYRRITDLLKKHGVHVAWYDCDGNIQPVIDCFLEGGVNTLFPVEVHGGSDPVEIRQRWPGIHMQGGVDKMILLKGPKAIRAELERIAPLVREGGFLPGIDHRVQADVTYENYRTYLKLKRQILGVGGKPQYDESKVG